MVSERGAQATIARVQARATGATSGGHYEQLVRRQRAELQDAYLKGVRRLRWDAGRLAAERERRLRELLVWAADRSPFWRERLAGRDLASVTESDLPSLPVLTRAEMMAEFDRVVTVPGLTLARVQQHLDQSDGDRGYLGHLEWLTAHGTGADVGGERNDRHDLGNPDGERHLQLHGDRE